MNILLSSAGRRAYLVNHFMAAMKDTGKVFVANSEALCTAFCYGNMQVVTPPIVSNEYIPFLLAYCQKYEIKAIIPLFDLDVVRLSEYKELFLQQGIQVLTAEYERVQQCNDKLFTYQLLCQQGIKTPYTTCDQAVILEKIALGELNYPIIIKPRWGMGSLAIYTAESEDEVVCFSAKIKREISRSYLQYEAALDFEHSVIYQAKIMGQEYGLDIINDLHGVYQTTIIKQKIAMRAGETDIAEIIFSEELAALGEKLAKIIAHPGNLDVDVFVQGGQLWVLELNARFGGGYPFSHLAGVDLPRALVAWLKGETVKNEWLEPQIGIVGMKELVLTKMAEGSPAIK